MAKVKQKHRVLVTGASGFLGAATCRFLNSKGILTLATGRNMQALKNLEGPETLIRKGDLSDLEFVRSLFLRTPIDAVIHCAGLSNLWGTWSKFHTANVLATELLVKQALASKGCRRFVYVSTPSIYAGAKETGAISEGKRVDHKALNHYIASKIQAESIIKDMACEKMRCIIIRPQGLFGPGDHSVIPRFIHANARLGIPRLRGGKHLIDATYVKNVAYALYLCLRKSVENHLQVFNITNGQPVCLIDFISLILAKIGLEPRTFYMPMPVAHASAYLGELLYKGLSLKGEPLLTRYSVDLLSQNRVLSIDAARRELGYQPIVSVEKGVKASLHWYRRFVPGS